MRRNMYTYMDMGMYMPGLTKVHTYTHIDVLAHRFAHTCANGHANAHENTHMHTRIWARTRARTSNQKGHRNM